MDIENRKRIALISFMRKFISIVFTLFFNIYVLKIVNDFEFVIRVNLISVIFSLICNVVILKFLNNKNARYIYNSSFIILIICIGLLLFLKDNIIKYIYFFKFLYVLGEALYSAPNEMVIMGSNNHKTFSSFQANINILSSIATILTPIISGFIIEKFSYYTLFILLILEIIIILLEIRKIDNFYIDDRKTNVSEFFNKAIKYNHIRDIYKCMLYRRISSQGAIIDLLPILLFIKFGNEFSVGAYSSLFAILSILSLMILKILNKKNVNKKFYIPFSIIIFISTLILVFKPNFVTIIMYYVFMNTLGEIIESESCSSIYEAIKYEELSMYKKEHDIVFNIYMFLGKAISYSITYILYRRFYNGNILSIVISVLMFFLIISSIYLQKTQNYYKGKNL